MPSEWRDNLARGSGAIGRRVFGLVSAIATQVFKVGGFISRGVGNIALLDPEFGKPQEVVIKCATSQVVYKGQPCEFLPQNCFKKCPNMKIRNGYLTVKGKMLPLFEMKDEQGRDMVDAAGNKLFAVNTNQTQEALGLFGLDRKTHLNKMLVVSSLAGEVVPVGGSDRRMMREHRNLKINVDTRRVVDRHTGKTLWLLTLLMLPIHLAAGTANLVLGSLYGLFYRTSSLLDRCSKYFEEEADRRIIGEANGTLMGGGSSLPYVLCGFLCRALERVLSFCSSVSGSVRSVVVQPLRSVPIFTNALYNQDELQYVAGKEVLLRAAGDTWQNVKCFCNVTVDLAKCSWARMSKDSVKLSQWRYDAPAGDADRISSRARGSELGYGESSEVRRGMEESRYGVVDRSGVRVPLLSEHDVEQVRRAGLSMKESGVKVSYGTKDQLAQLSEVLSTRRRNTGIRAGAEGGAVSL